MSDDLLGVSDDTSDQPVFGGTVEDSSPESNEKQQDGADDKQSADQSDKPEEKQVNTAERNFKAIREQLRQLKSENEGLIKAKELDSWVRQDPKRMGLVLGLMQGKDPSQLLQEFIPAKVEEKDPYGDFDPLVSGKFKELDELKRAIQEQKQQSQQATEQQQKDWIEHNKASIDDAFDGILAGSDFKDLPDEGKELIAESVIQELNKSIGKAELATIPELKAAANSVFKRLGAVTKHSLGKVSRSSVPASGSSQGVVPGNNKLKGSAGRMEKILNSLG